MIFCISIELVLKGKASFLIRTTNKSQQDNGRRGILFFYYRLIIEEATASQLLKGGPNMPPAPDPGKVKCGMFMDI